MNKMTWTPYASFKVSAKAAGLWTLALDYVIGPQKLKITASGNWQFGDPAVSCDPNGHPSAIEASVNCLCDKAPKGALIGKIGGSTADYKTAPVLIFVVGSCCVIDLPDPSIAVIPPANPMRGPLFLTMNDDMAGFMTHSGDLQVDISTA